MTYVRGFLGRMLFAGDDGVKKEAVRAALAAAYPFDNDLASTVVNGVNFVAIDDAPGTVTAAQAARVEAEFKKGLPTILCMHVPFNTPHIWRAATKFWAKKRVLYKLLI